MSSSDQTGPSSKPESSGRWQFIDASNNSRSNLTQVKRHVMQEYMRQKKGSPRRSESEDEKISSHPAKRGRPKKIRAAKRKSARKVTHDRSSSSETEIQPPPVAQEVPAPPENDAPADIEDVGPDWTAPAPTFFHPPPPVVQADDAIHPLPFRGSPIQPQAYQFPAPTFLVPPHTQTYPPGYGPDFNSPSCWQLAPTTQFEPMRSPRTILSAARTDPFNSLPLELDLDGQRLFDFYVNDMPACSYGTHFRSDKAHNWYRAVFVPEAMKGAVAFQNTILVHAANTWAWVRNEGETADALLHRDRAITMLREHMLNNPFDDSDVAIISCLSAAALEDFDPRPGRKVFSWIHMRAARDMIRARGGPAAFANTRLGMLINWQDYILSGYETRGPSFFFEPAPTVPTPSSSSEAPPPQPSQNRQSMPSPPDSTSSVLSDSTACPETPMVTTSTHTSPVDEIHLQCEEFLGFLRRCEQLALYQQDNPESFDLSRHTCVQETSLLFQILAAAPGARFTASGDRKQMVARLTSLMMLNAALWDYRYTPIHAGTFLATLEHAMIDSEVSMSGSVEAILQILLACNDGYIGYWTTGLDGTVSPALSEQLPDFTQYSPTGSSPSARPWFVGRMLKIAKRLSAPSWHRINDFLFACLTLRVSESTVYDWEPELRREILEAPLTSYIMPSLL
ncbi:hypothetical protein N7532_003943 [Penicillium argentinense]|uniref:Sigma-70 region 2 family protein n=1 Tax=Penicillium argentinense TaxID=1131581 RepID=A0A9W9FNJ5_9EURO|nr:uncharacterized protein N7532_003943 [Penicillium argentinense]KAJ5103414.1 hypothetical protein N7532_003943 [Penicillium argentinense]